MEIGKNVFERFISRLDLLRKESMSIRTCPQKLTILVPDENVEQQGLIFIACKQFGRVFFTSMNRAVTLLGIYSTDLKTYVHKNTSMQIFTATVFLIAKTWMLFSRRLDKKVVVLPYNRRLFSNKKE